MKFVVFNVLTLFIELILKHIIVQLNSHNNNSNAFEINETNSFIYSNSFFSKRTITSKWKWRVLYSFSWFQLGFILDKVLTSIHKVNWLNLDITKDIENKTRSSFTRFLGMKNKPLLIGFHTICELFCWILDP